MSPKFTVRTFVEGNDMLICLCVALEELHPQLSVLLAILKKSLDRALS